MTSEHKDELNYWPSFVDIFASLFFIFLILFSVYYASERFTSEAVKRDLEDLKTLTSENRDIVLDTLNVNLTIPADIFFGHGVKEYNLSATGESIAQNLGHFLGNYMGNLVLDDKGKADGIYRYKKYSVIIEGHTDTTGDPWVNNPLSLNRANSLIRSMKSVIDPAIRDSIEFIPVGYGESMPKHQPDRDNYKCEGNRRVEIKILPKFNETQLKVWRQIIKERDGE